MSNQNFLQLWRVFAAWRSIGSATTLMDDEFSDVVWSIAFHQRTVGSCLATAGPPRSFTTGINRPQAAERGQSLSPAMRSPAYWQRLQPLLRRDSPGGFYSGF